MLLPVGTDYTPPNKWVTEIHRDWNARYTWPRFVCALPREFFAAVRTELDERGIAPSPQTRDMNPIYTGKDVSYIDTKQANRAAENAVLDAERFAVFAGLLGGATYPQAALDKAWVQLAYGAHHDAITGSESDQVYLDLLTGWRDAWELGRAARDNALGADLQRRRRYGGGVEHVGAQPDRRRDGAARRAARRRRAGVDADGNECPRSSSTAVGRSAGWRATCRRWAGAAYRLTAGVRAAGWEAVRRQRDRQRPLPAAGRPGPRRRGVLADRRRPRADRRRQGRQRAGRLRRVPRTPARRRGSVAPAAQGAGGRTRRQHAAESVQCLPLRRWASGWSCAGGSARCCATPRP